MRLDFMPMHPAVSAHLYGGTFDPHLIDVGLLRQWLQQCDSFHGKYCHSSLEDGVLVSLSSLNLIYLEHGRLIKTSANVNTWPLVMSGVVLRQSKQRDGTCVYFNELGAFYPILASIQFLRL